MRDRIFDRPALRSTVLWTCSSVSVSPTLSISCGQLHSDHACLAHRASNRWTTIAVIKRLIVNRLHHSEEAIAVSGRLTEQLLAHWSDCSRTSGPFAPVESAGGSRP